MNTATSIKPLVAFFILAFALAWGLMGMVVGDHLGLFSIDLPLESLLIIGSWVPNIAAFIVLAFVVKKQGGIIKLLHGWLKLRVGVVWYVVAASPILLGFLTIALYKQFTGYSASTDFFSDPVILITTLILIAVTGAMGEELGWRGFALPLLLNKMNALAASMLLGVIWSIWHLPLWFAGLGFESNPFWAYAITGISFTIVLTWACNYTRGSLFIASLFHFSLNVAVNMFGGEALPLFGGLFMLYALFIIGIYGPVKLTKKKELPIDPKTNSWT
jgi:uncharacterized protein